MSDEDQNFLDEYLDNHLVQRANRYSSDKNLWDMLLKHIHNIPLEQRSVISDMKDSSIAVLNALKEKRPIEDLLDLQDRLEKALDEVVTLYGVLRKLEAEKSGG